MLADFAARLAFGLAVAALAAPRRSTPTPYFRTMCLVMLGLAVLATLAGRSSDASRGGLGAWAMIATAAVAYMGAVAWGMGWSRVGTAATAAVAGLSGSWLAGLALAEGGPWAFNAASRAASGSAMGATVAAMLMGHQYLTAPSTSIGPLRRAILLMAAALAARAALAAAGLALASGPPTGSASATAPTWLLPAMRWGMGLIAPAAAAALACKAAGLRSTQSATGVLYAGTALVMLGELASLILSRAGAPIV